MPMISSNYFLNLQCWRYNVDMWTNLILGLWIIHNDHEKYVTIFKVGTSWLKWTALSMGFHRATLCFSVPDGHKDLKSGKNCPQCPYLYRIYEATYTSKCLLFEKIDKNWFLTTRGTKKSVFCDFLKNQAF